MYIITAQSLNAGHLGKTIAINDDETGGPIQGTLLEFTATPTEVKVEIETPHAGRLGWALGHAVEIHL